jgi:hypothetical protein
MALACVFKGISGPQMLSENLRIQKKFSLSVLSGNTAGAAAEWTPNGPPVLGVPVLGWHARPQRQSSAENRTSFRNELFLSAIKLRHSTTNRLAMKRYGRRDKSRLSRARFALSESAGGGEHAGTGDVWRGWKP